MTKFYEGRPGDMVEPWQLIEVICDDAGDEWHVFTKPGEGEWVNVKLVANGRVPVKANYWAGYSDRRGTLARSRDAGLLKQGRPGLYLALLDALA